VGRGGGSGVWTEHPLRPAGALHHLTVQPLLLLLRALGLAPCCGWRWMACVCCKGWCCTRQLPAVSCKVLMLEGSWHAPAVLQGCLALNQTSHPASAPHLLELLTRCVRVLVGILLLLLGPGPPVRVGWRPVCWGVALGHPQARHALVMLPRGLGPLARPAAHRVSCACSNPKHGRDKHAVRHGLLWQDGEGRFGCPENRAASAASVLGAALGAACMCDLAASLPGKHWAMCSRLGCSFSSCCL
jgi:hypothetical protein